ncbi:probable dual specificity protein phosphatase 6 at N-terminal half [Coccomyxa sp. Obi]|nr:probable dual specificity protein phosphatase 6 at N-terminal half [Coccomyxa sp. Obi]
MQAYCIRLAANGKALLDYSKNSYDVSWSQDCWWDKAVIVYGDSKLKRDHPVVAFLANDKHAKSLAIYKEGFEGFQKAYPFLCSASVKNNAIKRYPAEIVPKVLYLGDWEHAQQTERLDELNVRRVITIHNNPENMQLPAKFKHLRLQLADVDTQDISKFFATAYTFIEEARGANEGVLVHCGAGVSRSAALCISYLMRRFTWAAKRAREHCKQRRSLVNPNQGFWRSLCAFEEQLGITDRSDPADTEDFHGADSPVLLAEGAAGKKVPVRFVPAGQLKRPDGAAAANGAKERAAASEPAAASPSARAEPPGREDRQRDDRHSRGGDRDRERGGDRHHRDRDRERERDGDRHRHDRDRDRVSERDRGRDDRGRERDTEGRRHREADREAAVERERGVKRSRDSSAERREKRHSGEGSKGTRGDAAAENGNTEPPSAAEPSPGVMLQVSKEGKVVGAMELGLSSIADKVVFGRAPTCDVVLEHLSISRQHAALSTDTAGNLFITDLGSGHGTYVDGVWIRANEPRLLKKGATFKIAASSREYKVLQVPRDSKTSA